MIRARIGTPLDLQNIAKWYCIHKKESERRKEMREIFENKRQGKLIYKLPFAKKLVLTASSGMIGQGVTLSPPDDLSEKQAKFFEEIQRILRLSNIWSQDKKIAIEQSKIGNAYELAYMSDDKSPCIRFKSIPSENAFIVFDDTVESRPMYSVYFDSYKKTETLTMVRIFCADKINEFSFEINETLLTDKLNFEIDAFRVIKESLSNGKPHKIGRVPLTKCINNDENQSDFEQVVDLFKQRSELHELAFADAEKIVNNILTLINAELVGSTADEKVSSRKNLNKTKVLELKAPRTGLQPDAKFLSKVENYAMIDVFGKDIDSHIYELSLIPDLTSDTFNNVTGVALEYKLKPFKELVSLKGDNFIDFYRERLRKIASSLMQKVSTRDGGVISSKFEEFDVDLIEVTINRNWVQNLVEIKDIIVGLNSTGLFSDEFLINQHPDADYEVEKDRKTTEQEEKSKQNNVDPNNFGAEWLGGYMRELSKTKNIKEKRDDEAADTK